MIDVRGVTKIHRRGQTDVVALHEISCHVPAGAFAFILGPSGSGKSTLLYLMGALDEPTRGEILVDGESIQRMNTARRDRFRREDVGFIFQNFNLMANLSAVDNVLVPFMPQGIKPGQREEATALLERVGLGDRLHHRPAHLSGGEQQRVAIARALLKRPRLILADEPTGELDTANGAAILAYLRDLGRERQTTVVIVTHEQEHVRPDDLTIRIRDGRLSAVTAAGAEPRRDGA